MKKEKRQKHGNIIIGFGKELLRENTSIFFNCLGSDDDDIPYRGPSPLCGFEYNSIPYNERQELIIEKFKTESGIWNVNDIITKALQGDNFSIKIFNWLAEAVTDSGSYIVRHEFISKGSKTFVIVYYVKSKEEFDNYTKFNNHDYNGMRRYPGRHSIDLNGDIIKKDYEEESIGIKIELFHETAPLNLYIEN